MRKSVKFFMLAMVAVIAGAFAAGTAAANTITASPSGAITATSTRPLTFTGRGLINISINCNVTLRGTLNRTINNAGGSSVGSITEGVATGCNSGSAVPLVEARTPWPLVLNGTTRLAVSPKLAELNVNNAKFQVNVAGQECLYEGGVPTQLEGEGPAEAVVTRNINVLPNAENRVRGTAFCPGRGSLEGAFAVTTQTLAL